MKRNISYYSQRMNKLEMIKNYLLLSQSEIISLMESNEISNEEKEELEKLFLDVYESKNTIKKIINKKINIAW